mgnify:CR=1 FL=1
MPEHRQFGVEDAAHAVHAAIQKALKDDLSQVVETAVTRAMLNFQRTNCMPERERVAALEATGQERARQVREIFDRLNKGGNGKSNNGNVDGLTIRGPWGRQLAILIVGIGIALAAAFAGDFGLLRAIAGLPPKQAPTEMRK